MILVADDNEDNLQIISRILRTNGFEVMVERNGKDALDRARESHPELIVMDVMMPEMSGTEVLEKLRESAHTSRIPVILLTAMAQNDDVINGYRIGADYYMTKPYTSKELLNGVRLVLGHNPTPA
jgi:DNA-binding response OmpR family regulator